VLGVELTVRLIGRNDPLVASLGWIATTTVVAEVKFQIVDGEKGGWPHPQHEDHEMVGDGEESHASPLHAVAVQLQGETERQSEIVGVEDHPLSLENDGVEVAVAGVDADVDAEGGDEVGN
jgi:hypothetical protein